MKRVSIISSVLLLLIVALMFWVTPFEMDDKCYMHIYPIEKTLDTPYGLTLGQRVHSLGDVFVSQYHHYISTNGRSIVHFFVQSFCGLWGKSWYNFISTIIFACFAFLLYFYAFMRKIRIEDCGLVVFLMGAFYVLMPEPTCFFHGVAYGINYLWTATFCLVYMLVFFENKHFGLDKHLTKLLFCFFAFLTGWTHEGFCIPIAAATFCYMACYWKKMSGFQKTVGCCFMLGTAFLVLAPGNFARIAISNSPEKLSNYRIALWSYLHVTCLLILGLLVLLFRSKDQFKSFLKDNWPLFVMWAVAMSFVVYIGVISKRSVFGIEFFAFILLFRLIARLGYSRYERVSWLSPLVVLFFAGVLYYQALASEQYRQIDVKLGACEDKNCVVALPAIHLPLFLQGYVCSPIVGEFEFVFFERLVFQWFYSKEEIYYFETDLPIPNSYNIQCYLTPDYKLKGDNPFYKLGNWYYSAAPIDDSMYLKCHLGENRVFDFYSLICKLVSLFRNGPSELSFHPEVEEIEMQGTQYYRVLQSPYNTREILSVDLVK